MNYTLIIVILLILLKLIGGYRKGMAREISNFIALMVAFIMLSLFIMLFSSFQAGETTNVIYSVVLLVLLGLVYGVVKIFLKSAKAVSHLPVLHLFDKLIGGVVGVLEAILIIWIIFLLCSSNYFGPITTIINEDIQESSFLKTLYMYNYFIK